MIDYSKYYTGFWCQGSCGNFIIYLMSCHAGFYKHDYRTYHANDRDNVFKDSHLQLNLPTWKHNSTTHKRRRELSFDYYYFKNGLNKHNKKVAFKQLPHGYDTKRILTEDHKKINFFIIEGGNNVKWLIDRNARLRGTKKYLDETSFQYPKLKKHLKKNNYTNTLFLDITKILTCDEEEYIKLCDWIKEEPLPNWKEIVQDYKKLVNIVID